MSRHPFAELEGRRLSQQPARGSLGDHEVGREQVAVGEQAPYERVDAGVRRVGDDPVGPPWAG